jgi:hypothetical protein
MLRSNVIQVVFLRKPLVGRAVDLFASRSVRFQRATDSNRDPIAGPKLEFGPGRMDVRVFGIMTESANVKVDAVSPGLPVTPATHPIQDGA